MPTMNTKPSKRIDPSSMARRGFLPVGSAMANFHTTLTFL